MPTVPAGEAAKDRIRQDLRQALRAGPFPAALHLAIEASGLTLDQIQVWLAERGALVSVPTLSYWRRGRSRPERPSSLQAVHLLEELLAVPGDSLVSLLGPRRARGRWVGHTPGSLDMGVLFDDSRPVDLLNGLGVHPRGAVNRISIHATVTVGADRRTMSVRLRELVRATVDRVSRCGVVFLADERPDNPPALANVQYCRIGRMQADRTAGLVAAELILDRVLDAGEPALLEYEWRFSPAMPMRNYDFRFSEPIREFVLQARFHPDAIPAQCHRYDRRTATAPEGNRRELWIGASHTALLAELDVPAGIVGMRWDWPETGLTE